MKPIQGARRVKVLGYPFAGGQPQSGVEKTPAWLQNQHWFKQMSNESKGMIEYEEVKVTDMTSNHEKIGYPKNLRNVMRSSVELQRQTYNALSQGYFPIVLGGDHSQAIGSVAGMKQMYPGAKILWVDAHIDANTPDTSPSKNMHGMPLAYLSGMVPFQQEWKGLDMAKDICYFGIRSYEPEEHDLIKEKGVLVFESQQCISENMKSISEKIDHHFQSK